MSKYLIENLFGIEGWNIAWYGVIIACGMLLGLALAVYRAKKEDIHSDVLYDFLLIAAPIAILCARAYYVIFEWESYADDPAKVFAIWEGGLAIYGGIIAGVIVAILFAKFKHIDFFNLGDLAVISLLIGQCIGRWGNFMNAEAFGGFTDLPWGMSINGAAPCHPTFLYESLWNLAGLIALHFYSKHRHFKGEIILLYFGWYGLGRAWIEGLRTDSLYIGNTDIRVSQLVAIVSFVVCLAALLYLHISKKYKDIKFLRIEK